MSVSLNVFTMRDLIVTEDYEYSERSRYVTEQVALFVQNNADTYDKFRALAGKDVRDFAWAVVYVLKTSGRGSAGWHTACELAIADFQKGRIRWDEVAESLIGE